MSYENTIAGKLLNIVDNIESVCNAVNAAKITVSGSHIRVDDVLDAEHPLQITTLPDATVNVFGKNLFNYKAWVDYCNSGIGGKGTEDATYLGEECFSYSCWRNADTPYMEFAGKESTQYTFNLEVSYSFNNTESYAIPIMVVVYSDGTTSSITVGTIPSSQFTKLAAFTTSANKTVVGLTLPRFSSSATIYIKKEIQVEEGTSATDYESFIEQMAAADADGNVTGLISVSPIMTIVSDDTVDCTYFPQSAADVYEKYQQLIKAEKNLRDTINN